MLQSLAVYVNKILQGYNNANRGGAGYIREPLNLSDCNII